MAKTNPTKRVIQKLAPIGKMGKEPMILPNYSGVKRSLNEGPQDFDLREGTIQHTPTDAKDIVNKEYVDSTAGAGLELFLTEDADGVIASYMQLVPYPTGNAEENTVTAISSAAPVLVEEYATPVGCSCLTTITSLPAGIVRCHLHAKGEVTGRLKLYYELYKRDNVGTETLLGTSDISDFLTTGEVGQDIHLTLTEETAWASTDRIVLKIYGTSTLAANKNLTIYCEGDTASRVRITGVVPVGHNVTAGSVLTDETIVQGDSGGRGIKTSTATIAQVEAAVAHYGDNSQAHTDYMLNTGDTSTGTYSFAGNVGIGTASPTGVSTGPNFNIEADGDIFPSIRMDRINAVAKTDADWEIFIGTSGHLYFRDAQGGDSDTFIIEQGAPANSLTIDDSGDVGIGTASPATNLVIQNNGLVEVQIDSDDGNESRLNLKSAARDWYISDNKDGNYKFNIYRDTETPYFTIDDANGNVGIGTTSPSYKLEVKSPSTSTFAIAAERSSNTNLLGGIYEDGDGDGSLYLYDKSNNLDIFLNTAGNTYFNGGNVGIGDSTPSYPLDVTGRVRSTLGRVPAGSIHATVTENVAFDTLKASVPATNDEIIVTGSIAWLASNRNVVSKIKRVDATNIDVYYMQENKVVGTYRLTDGDGTQVGFSMAW